jgi:hypothetical protein
MSRVFQNIDPPPPSPSGECVLPQQQISLRSKHFNQFFSVYAWIVFKVFQRHFTTL